MKCQVNLQFGCMKIFLRHSRIHFKSRLFSTLNCLILLPPQNLTNMHNKHFKQLFPLVQFGCPKMLRSRRIYLISNFTWNILIYSWMKDYVVEISRTSNKWAYDIKKSATIIFQPIDLICLNLNNFFDIEFCPL